eukprot:5256385-Alexandrium_andersonii.AAC.1
MEAELSAAREEVEAETRVEVEAAVGTVFQARRLRPTPLPRPTPMPQPPTPAASPPPAVPQVFEVRQWIRQQLLEDSTLLWRASLLLRRWRPQG